MREQSSKKIKNQKAITLITLVVTIGILLILSAVTISTIKKDGIIDQAQNVTDRVEVQSLIDEIKMDILRKQTIENKEITEEELNGILSQYGTVKDGVLHVDDLNCDIPISDIWTSTMMFLIQICIHRENIRQLMDGNI